MLCAILDANTGLLGKSGVFTDICWFVQKPAVQHFFFFFFWPWFVKTEMSGGPAARVGNTDTFFPSVS